MYSKTSENAPLTIPSKPMKQASQIKLEYCPTVAVLNTGMNLQREH